MTEEAILRIAEIKDEMNTLLVDHSKIDLEGRHIDADNLLCELLTILGYESIASDFKEMHKWYS